MLGTKLSFQKILFSILLALLELLFRIWTNAVQIEFLHNGYNSLFANMNTAFSKYDADLLCAKALTTVIENLLNLQHQLFLFPLVFTSVGTP